MTNKLAQRFVELEGQLRELQATKKTEYDTFSNSNEFQVDRNLLLGWEVKVRSLLEKACGLESPHLKQFLDSSNGGIYSTSWRNLERMSAVYLAAKEDYEGGYLSSVRSLVQAEVFDSELEQASELLNSGYKSASAVIAGTVLETSLRELCDRYKIAHGKLDRMNADLVKQGAYNANMAKRITAIAATRNSAAHGNPQDFTDGDVSAMIVDIERFLAQHLT